jgi:NADH-quinone oxidoreductase subunit H
LIGLAGVSLGALGLWNASLFPERGFSGDVIVVLYLLTLPALGVILGAFASCNPLASLGGSREMKLLLSYELPLLLATLVPIITVYESVQSIRLAAVSAALPVGSLSGILALVVAILCMQAKLTLVPFDAPEAETELTGGAYVEYSGPPLAIFKLTRAMMLFTMPLFLVTLFCGGIGFRDGVLSGVLGLLKVLGLVVVVILIRNTAPRVRIDQAVRFFWGPVTIVAFIAVLLAVLGV